MSKGSGRRPSRVSEEELRRNWDKAFGKAKSLKEDTQKAREGRRGAQK